MKTQRLTIAAALVFAQLAAAHAARAEPPAAAPTAQQRYDDAMAAFARQDWPAAIHGLETVAAPDDGASTSHSQGIIHAQLARAHAYNHETENAVRELPAALRGLGEADVLSRGILWLAIADAQRFDLDLPAAANAYEMSIEAGQQTKTSELIVQATSGLALRYMTEDPAKSKALLDGLLATPALLAVSKVMQAMVNDLRGRASLNLGRPQEAIGYLTKAIDLSGGVRSNKVSLRQIQIRGDAAIGALLTKRAEDARQYLAWTGAGRLPSEEWHEGMGDPPVCGGASDIQPDDMAVVEFSIDENGHTIDVSSIYASRSGTMGTDFARAVKAWKWNPEKVAKLPPFWRHLIRLELRCISRPRPEGLAVPFINQTTAWLAQNNVSPVDIQPLKDTYIRGDDPRLDREDLAAIPVLMARLYVERDRKRVAGITQHLMAALDRADAPAPVRAVALHLTGRVTSYSPRSLDYARAKAKHLAAMERVDPTSAATAWLALEYAIALESAGYFKNAKPVLERVVGFPLSAVGADDPLRDVAILHLAALQRRAGDVAAADRRVNDAGLTRAQCMLFDVRPVATSQSVTGVDFPEDARRWGFDGFVREAFDIDADGRVEHARAIIAYPPFVFPDATNRTIKHFRFIAPVVEGGAAGCDGTTVNFNYANVH